MAAASAAYARVQLPGVPYASQGSNPRLADRVSGRPATHALQPCLGQALLGGQRATGALLTMARLSTHNGDTCHTYDACSPCLRIALQTVCDGLQDTRPGLWSNLVSAVAQVAVT